MRVCVRARAILCGVSVSQSVTECVCVVSVCVCACVCVCDSPSCNSASPCVEGDNCQMTLYTKYYLDFVASGATSKSVVAFQPMV